jgi:hypothetical protein
MISLITCSLTPTPDPALLKNIEETIGVPFELICVDNSSNRYSIFSAYNYGSSIAKYDLLCFMHSDILFHTAGWGKIVADKLDDPNVGVIGVAGAILKSEELSPWWISDTRDFNRYLRFNILQHFRTGATQRKATGKDPEEKWNEVVILDGVWMCCRKEIWRQTPFDERSYKGFHFYDLDFSLASFQKGYKNFVSQQILLEHFSAGFMDKTWIETAGIFHKKWNAVLPLGLKDVSTDDFGEIRDSAVRDLLRIMIYNRCHDLRLWLKYWFRVFRQAPFARDTFMFLFNFGKSYFR